MQIFARGTRTITIDVELTDTVLSLKEKISDREGVHPSHMILTWGGRHLEDDLTLEYYGIRKEYTVHHRIRFGPGLKTVG
jgi:hypothetical protein